MDMYKIEKKWQTRWEKRKIFEADPYKAKKFFITFPYPYLNGAPHIGHSFSSFRVDAYARFKRMQGYNVLFPQGFHATGEPILGAVERLQKNDATQINTFKSCGASDADIERFKKDIKYVIHFWKEKWLEDMKAAGFSIDWRRSFITAVDDRYNKFIEWQYNTLKRLGYVKQGTHPVIWCPHCSSPTGDHDRLEGEGESPVDYVILKFKLKDSDKDAMLPAATLRPETIYGVTNMWVNPGVEYVMARVNDEMWILSLKAVEKLKDQLNDVEIMEKIDGSELLGKRCIDPIGNREIPILPAVFVDPDSATGIVMSVPSHAPYDWAALKELMDKNELERYGVMHQEVEPIPIIKTPGLEESPAVEIYKRMGIKSSRDPKLESATSRIYKKEFHQGILNVGEHAGAKVSEVKDELMKDFLKRKIADVMWECNLVVCRCTTKCHVKILENQWFLAFSNEKWKSKVRKCIKGMKIYPDEARVNFLNTVEWLKDKACTRKTGLGTKLPWDDEWIVETLSDSTIYMAYYTLAKVINEKKVSAEKLTHEFFDYVLLNKGNMRSMAKKSGLQPAVIKEMKRQFNYFYPVDMRNSGKDLIQNHLTFYLFHHTAIFPQKMWPKAIGVNGFVNVEGEKMSKSKGNFLTLRCLLDQYGADLTRINIVAAAEGLDDADWRAETIKSYRNRIELLYDIIKKTKHGKSKKKVSVDKWLLSAMQSCIKNATECYEKMKFRSALQYALFDSVNNVKWYAKRGGCNDAVLREALSDIVLMLSPVAPHAAEEMWELLGNRKFAACAKWPAFNKKLFDEKSSRLERLLEKTIEDAKNIIALVKKRTNKEPKSVSLFIAKRRSFKKKANKAKQLGFFKEAQGFIEHEIGCRIAIIDADKIWKDAENIQKEKAGKATPEKLGILIE
ncbi:MAG: leucine--tRNA ligase [Candidatus Aenigmarchaeota archaeon]|nr:leucine--tRNA ligase [Candidatus Aenigmarchaeota archaeon]